MPYRFQSEFALGTCLAGLAVAVQCVLGPVFARDSYQLFLGAVAVSAIRGGTGNGAVALSVSALAKTGLFFMPGYPGHGQIGLFLARMTMFLLVGSALCSVGGAVHISLERLDRNMSRARLLRGLLPICSCCKRIMDERGHWCDLEKFIARHSDAEFTHGFCPRCAAEALQDSKRGGW